MQLNDIAKTLTFKDYPDFKPNLTPEQMFSRGIFGGAYFRPIHSGVTGKDYEGVWEKYKCIQNVPENLKGKKDFDFCLNKYKVAAGSSLLEWESKGWIVEQDPYGWVQWYCEFYDGRRSEDDARQIDRWNKYAGPKSGRWRTNLINKIKNAGGLSKLDDVSISPVVRQGLLQWGYELTSEDYKAKTK